MQGQNSILIEPGDAWFLMGNKGRGKTSAAKQIALEWLRLFPRGRLRALDFKARQDFKGWPNHIFSPTAPPIGKWRVGVWTPTGTNPLAIEAYLHQFREEASEENPLAVIIDEISALIYGSLFSEEYAFLQKLGRTLPCTTFTNAQELAGIPRQARGLADHYLRFGLNEPYDQRMANKLVRHVGEPKNYFGFIYAREDNSAPGLEYENWQEFLGRGI